MSSIKKEQKALEAKMLKLENTLEKNIEALERAYQKEVAPIQKQLAQLEEVESGDKPDAGQAARIKSQKFSYTVHFERRKNLLKVRSPGAVCVSERRFTSAKEATHHAKRFAKLHKHKSFTVVMVNKRANAWINWTTGKTNPVIG